MQIFARGRERFGGGVLKVPDLVLHAVVELVWVLFSFQVKLAADGGVLECFSYDMYSDEYRKPIQTILAFSIPRAFCSRN